MAKSMKPGGGGRFEKMEHSLAGRMKHTASSHGQVHDAGALAAYIGRKKYGKEAFQHMAAKGRARAK